MTTRRGFLSTITAGAAALPMAGVASGRASAAEPMGANDRKIVNAWHERRRLYEALARIDYSYLDRDQADAVDRDYFQRIDTCDATIMDTPADDFAGFAVKVQLAYAAHSAERGNENGDQPPPDNAHPLRDDVVLARIVRELQSRSGVEV